MGAEHTNDIEPVLARYAAAWAAGDFAEVSDCYHDDIVFHYFGRNPLAGEHRGKAACLTVLKQVRERTNRSLIRIHDVMAGANFGILMVRERFDRPHGSFEVDRVLRYSVREGKLAEFWIYDEDQRLIDELLS